MVSSRWSYGPDGLRERPVAPSPLLPRWRDLQPLLLRSAGVVGLVATIMAVVSSDALHLGAEEPAVLAAIEPVAPPVVAPAAELRAAPELAAPEPVVAAEAAAVVASPSEPITAESHSEPETELPAASTPIAIASASETVEPASEPGAALAPDLADFAPADEPELVLEPVEVASVDDASLEAATDSTEAPSPSATAAIEPATGAAPTTPAPPVLASELRSETTPAVPTSEVATTASVPASAGALASLSPHADDRPAAEISLSALRSSDPPEAAAGADRFAWPDGAASCPRDWVEGEEGSRADDGGADCMTTTSLFASIAEDEQSVLEDAAAEEATVIASLPRVPLPRPEPPADFEPSNPHKTARVNSRNSSWPPEPPPNCAAGQHAKWRFVDRRAGTKEWYCK